MKSVKVVGASLLAVLLVAAIGVGAWRLNWYVETKNTDKRTEIYSHSDGRQLALVDAILADIRQVTGANVPDAQRTAIIGEVCDMAGKLTGKEVLPQSARTFVAQECNQ